MKKLKSVLPVLLMGILTFFSCQKKETHKPVYLNLFWHQHQPSYEDARSNSLLGPWVRTHATKDYFDMAFRLKKYPDLHVTINLSSILLKQLDEYYLKRLGPFIRLSSETFDVDAFRSEYLGKTDPWIDLLITDSRKFTRDQKDLVLNLSGNSSWNCFSVSERIIQWFPEYIDLIPEGMSVGNFIGKKDRKSYSARDLIHVKFLFHLANFDPLFLRGPVELPIRDERGNKVYSKLHQWVRFDEGNPADPSDDRYFLKKEITEDDCKQLVVEIYKVLASVIRIHQELNYDVYRKKGQIEVITTPYYHPILPLIYDSDIMKVNQPDDPTPARFSYPEDAAWHVRLGVEKYKEYFQSVPNGMWPGEGSVSKDIISTFYNEGIRWIATGPQVLARSLGKNPGSMPGKEELATPYLVKGSQQSSVIMFFRDLKLSDDIAFVYTNKKPREAVDDFVANIMEYAKLPQPDPLVTVLLDGENCWEYYQYSHDGNEFLDLLYHVLDSLQKEQRIITVTPTEYIEGNPERGVPSHSASTFPVIESLWPGCWFAPDFSIWIGDEEENTAWEYLLKTRNIFRDLNLRYNPEHPNVFIRKAWESMFAAEGSDWFWWYGPDQTAPGNADKIFDQNFRQHLYNACYFLQQAGFDITVPEFPPIISSEMKVLAERPLERMPSIDGNLEKIWKQEAAYVVDDEGAAQFTRSDLLKTAYCGYREHDLYLALELSGGISPDSVAVFIYLFKNFDHPVPSHLKSSVLTDSKEFGLYKWNQLSPAAQVVDSLMEYAIRSNRIELRWKDALGEEVAGRMGVFLQVFAGEQVDYAPNSGWLQLQLASRKIE